MSDEDNTAEVEASAEAEVKRKRGKAAKAAKPAKAKANGKQKLKAKTNGKKQIRKVDPDKLDRFGFRLGSKKAKAAQLYASKKGATLAEVKKVLKSTQYNLLTELEDRGFKIKREPVPGSSGRQITRFQIVI